MSSRQSNFRRILRLGTAIGSTLIGALIAGGIEARAQSGPNPGTEVLEAQDLIMGDISVTATRSPISVLSYPGMVTVLDREEIQRRDPAELSDLLRDVPAVFFEGGPRRTGQVPSIRGFEQENVQIRIDGARANFVSGHDGRVFLDPALLSSAEVLRGGASSLYGSGALGGVLSFRTISAGDLLGPDDIAAIRGKFGFQSVNDEFAETITLGGRPSDRVGIAVGLVKRDSGDIELADGNRLTSDDDILTGLIKGDVRLTDDLDLSLSYLGFKNDAREPDNGQGGNEAGDSAIVDKEIESQTFRAAFTYQPLGSDLIDLDGTVYFANNGVEERAIGSGRVTDRDVDTLGFFIDNRSRFDLSNDTSMILTVGTEGSFDEQEGFDSASPNGERGGVPDAETENLGVFLQADLEIENILPGTLRVIPGVRFDSFDSQSVVAEDNGAEEISPKLGVSYEPIPGLVGFANYNRAFRAPSFNELYNDGTHFVVPLGPGVNAVNSFVPNPDLDPEVSDNFEVGAGFSRNDLFTPGDGFRIKGSYFHADVENLIDIDVNFALAPGCFNPLAGPCNAGTTETVNRADAELDGFELEASYDHPRFYLLVGASTVEGKDKATGEYIGSLSPDRLTTDLGIKMPEKNLIVAIEGEFVAEFDTVNDPAEERGAFAIADVYLQWTPDARLLQGLSVNLGIDNLLDTDHERVFAGVPGPGRNFKASVAYRMAF